VLCRAVRSEGSIADPLHCPFIAHELMRVVVVVPRNPLTAMAQDTTPVMPLSQAMEVDFLVPERAFSLGSDGVVNAKIKIGKSLSRV
jgi:hypothetical protein